MRLKSFVNNAIRLEHLKTVPFMQALFPTIVFPDRCKKL